MCRESDFSAVTLLPLEDKPSAKTQQSALPNSIPVFRLILVLIGVYKSQDVTACILCFLLSAVLDVMERATAKRLGESYTSSWTVALELIVDMIVCTALFGLACFQAFPRLRVLATLILGLEWVGTLALAQSTVCAAEDGFEAGWKTNLLQRCNSNAVLDTLTRRYLSNDMQNALALISKVSHFALPLSLYAIANVEHVFAATPLALLAAVCIPGCLLYVYISFQTILTFVPTWISGSSPCISAPLQLVSAFHIFTFPLLLLFLPGLRAPVPDGRDDQAFFYLVKSAAKRLMTGLIVYLQLRDGGADGLGKRSFAVGVASTAWTWAACLMAYWEAGDVIPILHGSLYKDLTVDKWIIDAEQAVFRSQPAVDWRTYLGADHGSLLFELYHVIYFCFIPMMVITGCAMRFYAPLLPYRFLLERNMVAIYAAMSLCWLSFPVYGPVISLGPTFDAGLSESASHIVWHSSHQTASTGTALPSGHCAVSTMIALSVMDITAHCKWLQGSRRFLILGFYFALTANICFSTVFNGFHYVLDVVCGVLLAVVTHAVCNAALGTPIEIAHDTRSIV